MTHLIQFFKFALARHLLRSLLLASITGMALSLMACGQNQAQGTTSLKVEGFAEYVSRFEESAQEHGKEVQITNLEIRFGEVDLENETGGRGVCEYSTGFTPVITISRQAWENSNDDEREELIFHELGHCILMKAHEGGINRDGIPRSLMSPSKIDGSLYSQFRPYYLAKLFQN